VTGLPCSSLPVAKIRPPLPGDTMVSVTAFVPGSVITIYAVNGGVTTQIAAGGGPEISLTQPIMSGDSIYVVQSLGDCQATNVFVIDAGCAGLDTNVCSGDWPAFRHSGWRDGQQTMPSALTDPDEVRKLKQVWTFTAPAADMPIAFRASPIVFQGRVFVGNGNGRLYALNAATGALLWEYPPPPAQALVSEYSQVNPSYTNPSGLGLAASATIAMDANERPMVVFGAPDPSLGAKMGSGRLFALDPASGAAIWKSPEIAVVNGLTSSITNEAVAITQRHEQFGYSSPLALGNLIYVGITDHADDPIQNGRVVAVNMGSGLIDAAFTFDSTSTRGGDVWSSVAGGLDKNVIVTTTGNSANWSGGSQSEPTVDNALSMLGLAATSGAINWKLRAVPFNLDMDPDWSAGASLLDTRCGHAAASTEKDGWTYAAESTSGGGGMPKVFWQFPPTGIPFTSGDHDDTRYIKPGAGWNDTYIVMDGGYDGEANHAGPGFTRLHALDVCAPSSQPVLWIADIPDTTACPGPAAFDPNSGATQSCEYQLGPPTVTGGIVFVGTAAGHLIVLADPSVYASALSICSNPDVPLAQCTAQGFALVQRPIQLLDLSLGSGFGGIQTEPVLAGGHVFIAGNGGQVTMLATGK
jgi:outer membrane protein assembly factor BamB